MKRIISILFCLLCVGCNSDKSRTANPNYESIRKFAENAKKQENATFKQTIKEETATHKAEQAKYSAMIAHPEKFAEVVDITTGVPVAEFQPAPGLPDITDPNTPLIYKIDPVTGAKTLVKSNCPDGKCK